MSQKLPARNRVIYQSEALFISPDCTGYHLYYKPDAAAAGGTYPDDCLIQINDANSQPIFFDACDGVTRADATSAAAVVKDWKYTALPCTGNEELDPLDTKGLTGLNPILNIIGGADGTTIVEGSNSNSLEKIGNQSIYSCVEQIKEYKVLIIVLLLIDRISISLVTWVDLTLLFLKLQQLAWTTLTI